MKPQCIQAVNAAYGREATPAEITAIEQRLSRAMQQLARADRTGWLAKTQEQRIEEGAAAAAREIAAEAQKKLQRQALQITRIGELQQTIADFPGSPLDALSRIVAFHADAQGSIQSVESRASAIRDDALRQMISTLEATNPRFWGLFENPEGVRDLVMELHGEASGNQVAAKGAEQFKQIAEALRQRYNRAGGDVGQLDDWGMPHHHSQVRVARAGREQWLKTLTPAERAKAIALDRPPPKEFARDHWVGSILPAVDRSRYLRPDGSMMDDNEVTELFRGIWLTIATGGINKLEPGAFRGNGMMANRGSESRQVHFRSAKDYLDYQSSFGEHTPYETLTGHIAGIARDIAAVETFGPNPAHAFRLLQDQAVGRLVDAEPARSGAYLKQAQKVEALFDHVTGRTLPVASERLARAFDTVRNSLVANRLGSAVITSITDEGTMMRMASVNNLPQLQLWRNELAAMNPTNAQERRFAQRAGLALNTLVNSLNRFGNEGLGAGFSSKIAGATLRASGLNYLTDARRRAWGVTMMDAYGSITSQHARLADLDPSDHRILLSKGITETDFAVWKRAELEDWTDGNDTVLTPDAIYRIPDEKLSDLGDPAALREEAVTKLLGAVLEETNMAVIEPGARERALMMSGLQRGTWKGELTRSVFLFKSFPIAMITKHWARALSEPTPNRRLSAMLALTTSSTLLGMVAMQAAQLRDGKDPRNVREWKTWMGALLKGGALSIYGDFLFADETEHGRGAFATLLGPVAGLAEESVALTWGNALQAAKGEETDFGAELVRFAKGNTPGLSAAINLWYTRAAVDHLLIHDLQEAASPGYLRRMENRARNEFGTEYWWAPGGSPLMDSGETLAPERTPDFEAGVADRN